MTEHMRLNRRDLLRASGAFGAGMLLAPGVSWSVAGDTIRFRVAGDLQVLDPAFMIGRIEEIMMRCIYVSLTRLDDTRKGSPWEPYGAEAIGQVDPKTIKFTLRKGLKWTGGFGNVTAEDVKFSYERIANPKNESAWAYQFEKLDHVEVVDERTGIIHLKEAFQPFWVTSLPYYGGHIVCKNAVEKAGGKFTTEPPAQCGPYIIERWDPKQKVTLIRNPDWTGPKPDFARVELIIVEDDQAARLAFEANAFDYTKVAVSAAKQLRKKMPPKSKLLEMQSSRYVWLTVNVASPRLGDPRIRRAIQYAYDSDSVLAGVYDNLVPRSAGVVQPGTRNARSKNIIAKRDVAKAKALLAEAGTKNLTITLDALNDSNSLATAQIIQASLGEAGITVEVRPRDEGAYWSIGDKTQGDGYKNLDLVLMNFLGGVDPSENLVWFRPDQVGVYNWSGFADAEYEDLYIKGLSETNADKRAAIYNRMEDIMEESGGFVFICHEPLVAIHRDSVSPVILADGLPNPAATSKV